MSQSSQPYSSHNVYMWLMSYLSRGDITHHIMSICDSCHISVVVTLHCISITHLWSCYICMFYWTCIWQMLVSGGVDSTVCAALLHRALPHDQVIALHIDNGFMRHKESQKVEESLRSLGLQLNGNISAFLCLLTSASVSNIMYHYTKLKT